MCKAYVYLPLSSCLCVIAVQPSLFAFGLKLLCGAVQNGITAPECSYSIPAI